MSQKLIANSIPYSQYLRLRRNCSRDIDFQDEANLLYGCLRDRGYTNSILKKAFNRAKTHVRETLIHKKTTKNESQTVRIITCYTKQHKQVRQIIEKYWPLLLADLIVTKYVEKQPQITYRRVKSLKDCLTQSHYKTPPAPSHFPGTFSCDKCDKCRFMPNNNEGRLPNGQIHSIRHRTTCQTQGIVYLMQCTCNCFYVGKTKRPFL